MSKPLSEPDTTPLRLDIWLDVSCLFRTRSEAQKACKGGKVDLNGHPAKPNREVKPGDTVAISRPLGRRQVVVVVGTSATHVPKAVAKTLYEDRTPPPSAEEQAMLDLLKAAGLPRRPTSAGTPDRRERRRLRSAKESGG